MSEWVLGIDGGGSGSRAIALSTRGEILARADGGALNFYTTSLDRFRASFSALRYEIVERVASGDPVRTAIGTAALLDVPGDEEQRAVAAVLGDIGPWTLTGDAVAALFGATGGRAGILAISGTGSVVVAMARDGRRGLRGGFGPMVGGDPGSAFWLASNAVLLAQDNEALATEVCAYFDAGALQDIIRPLYQGGFDCARLAGLAEHLAGTSEDPEWIDLQDAAGAALAQMVEPLVALAGPNAPIYGAGSVLRRNALVRTKLEDELCAVLEREVEVEEPLHDAATGAALLALRESGHAIDAAILEKLGEGR